jgi:N-acetylglucosamine-6-phosphate deacetylase
MTDSLSIVNARPIGSFPEDGEVSIEVRGGSIRALQREAGRGRGVILDAEGRTVAPGFIDIHIQGAGGADVLDGTPAALRKISAACARFGATAFLATTVYRNGSDNSHLAVAAKHVGKNLGGARLIGIHLEGPFISAEKRGMIHPECLARPSGTLLSRIEELTGGTLAMMTIAPELPGCLDIIARLKNAGVIASFGHSNATYEQTVEGFRAGITHVTHLFNAMPTLHHRAPGPLLAILGPNGPSVQIIPDGVHLDPRVLKFIFDLLDARRCITITDGMQALGMPEGRYVYNGMEYESKNGTAVYPDGTLIGTTLGLIQMVLLLMEHTDCSLETAVMTVTENPARLLRLQDKKGSIAEGKDADLVVLDHDYSVWATVVDGRIVYRKQ